MANTEEKNQGSVVAVFGQYSGVENGVNALKDAEYDTNKERRKKQVDFFLPGKALSVLTVSRCPDVSEL